LIAVRELLNRTLRTGVIAVLMVASLGAGLELASLRASAQAGGMMDVHATFGRADFHRLVGQPLVRPGQAPPVVVSGGPAPVNRPLGFERARHHRRFFGFGLPVVGGGLYYGPYYGPFDGPLADVGAIARPPVLRAVEPIPEGGDRLLVNRTECRSETRVVPSEAGGERPIKMTFCRKE
jgi:hypothetical protein